MGWIGSTMQWRRVGECGIVVVGVEAWLRGAVLFDGGGGDWEEEGGSGKCVGCDGAC